MSRAHTSAACETSAGARGQRRRRRSPELTLAPAGNGSPATRPSRSRPGTEPSRRQDRDTDRRATKACCMPGAHRPPAKRRRTRSGRTCHPPRPDCPCARRAQPGLRTGSRTTQGGCGRLRPPTSRSRGRHSSSYRGRSGSFGGSQAQSAGPCLAIARLARPPPDPAGSAPSRSGSRTVRCLPMDHSRCPPGHSALDRLSAPPRSYRVWWRAPGGGVAGGVASPDQHNCESPGQSGWLPPPPDANPPVLADHSPSPRGSCGHPA